MNHVFFLILTLVYFYVRTWVMTNCWKASNFSWQFFRILNRHNKILSNENGTKSWDAVIVTDVACANTNRFRYLLLTFSSTVAKELIVAVKHWISLKSSRSVNSNLNWSSKSLPNPFFFFNCLSRTSACVF